MQEDKFWKYIELAQKELPEFNNIRAYEEYQIFLIKQSLVKQSFKEIFNFNKIYIQKVNKLLLPNVVELFTVRRRSFEDLKDGQAYISNDGFRDFRGWIIGLGRENYQLLKDFKKEEEIIHFNFYVENAYRDDLEFIINDLYEAFYAELKDAEIDKMYKNRFSKGDLADFGEISEQIDWANLDKKYPKMFAKYSKESI